MIIRSAIFRLLLASGALLVTGASCTAPELPARYGVAYSPRGMDNATKEDGIAFFKEAKAFGNLVAFHTNWRSSLETSGEVPLPALVAQAAKKEYGIVPTVGIGWTIGKNLDLASVSSPNNNTWTNVETQQKFVAMVTAYAREYRPPFLFLGNEVNMYASDMSPEEWQAWVQVYRQSYEAIKQVSPSTIVFTTFQYERLKGLGKKNGWTGEPQWQLIEDIARYSDALGFTTYPFFEYDMPGDIPDDYYKEIDDHRQPHWPGRVIFTEVGWKAEPYGPYAGSPQDQADFVSRFADLTSNMLKYYSAWLFLNDPPQTPPAFTGMGLRAVDGTSRPAETTWQNLVKENCQAVAGYNRLYEEFGCQKK